MTSAPTLWVITAAESIAFPDFSAVGYDVPRGTSYRFGVGAMAGLADLETATGGDGILDPWARVPLGMPPAADGGLSVSGEVVVTAP